MPTNWHFSTEYLAVLQPATLSSGPGGGSQRPVGAGGRCRLWTFYHKCRNDETSLQYSPSPSISALIPPYLFVVVSGMEPGMMIRSGMVEEALPIESR